MNRSTFSGFLAVAILVALASATGIPVRATYGAQTSADEPQYLLSALSLWEDGDLDISDERADRRYLAFHEAPLPQQTKLLEGGSRISPHGPLLPLLLAVPMGLWGWEGAKATLAVIAGATAGLLAWVAHQRFGARPWVAAGVVGVFALSPPFAVYATQVYPELPAAFFVSIAVACLTANSTPRRGAGAVLSVVALPWLATKYIPVAAVLGLAALLWVPRARRPALMAAFGGAAIVYLLVHQSIYGGLTPYAAGDHFVGGELTAVGTEPNLWGRASRLVGLMVDRGFGIAAWQPAYLLVPVAVGAGIRLRYRGFVLLSSLLGVGWLVAAFMALTMHGWWFPGRQLVVVLPAAVLIVARWADTSWNRVMAISALGLVGVGAFVALVIEGRAAGLTWVVDFAAVGFLPYRTWSSLLPDYMAATPATWAAHAGWSLLLVSLLALGFRAGNLHEGSVYDPDDERQRETV